MGSDAWGWAGGVGRTRLACQDIWQYFNSDRKCQLFYELDVTASSFSQVTGMNLHTSMSNEMIRLPSWLDPVRLQSSGGLSRNEIIRIQRVVGEYQIQLREAWNAYFHD